MPELPRSHLLLYAVAGLLVVVLGARWARGGEREGVAPLPAVRVDAPDGAGSAGGGRGASATVHVAGEVREPGVYRLRAGTRVEGAIERAGGPTRHANLDGLNLAAKVDDGRQVVVPRAVEAAAGGAAPAATAPGGAGSAPASPTAPAAPVNLNSATVEELGTLEGVGPATAEKIVAYRTEHGGFRSVDELDQVSGIGEKRMATLRPLVTV